MTIQRDMDSNKQQLLLYLSGRLDTGTAPQLEAALKEDIQTARQLTLDFQQLEYLSSAGLRVLLATQKIMQAKEGMVIRHVNAVIMEIFDITGFSDILTIEHAAR
ncbi:MAG: STAS domain-containing protein [Oscillospiraceae bacterium]|nr:STAS domain-containing protein [Oscillospiraceae bacterium]MDD4367628.1 STAS domain-containing protein [Oscillospiraceae bacterium]